MPMVFVHGVNTRRDSDYDAQVAARDAMFRRFAAATFAADPARATILNPYWGDLGVRMAWNDASLPQEPAETFGGQEELLTLLVSETFAAQPPGRDAVLVTAARRSLPDAIDLLVAASVQAVGSDPQGADDLAEFAARALAYARRNPTPAWLATTRNDQQFLRELQNALEEEGAATGGAPEAERFGLVDRAINKIKEGAARLGNAALRFTSERLLEASRLSLHRRFARFLGDTFVYLDTRGTPDAPGPIVQLVIEQLREAAGKKSATDQKLVVIGHSMGGNILYDVLSHFRPDIPVDAFVTVGSQVGVFAEMGLFPAIRIPQPVAPGSSPAPVSKPQNVACWLNVFDEVDVLAFATSKIFAGSADFSFSTQTGTLAAHGAYFAMPSFHERLAERLRSVCP